MKRPDANAFASRWARAARRSFGVAAASAATVLPLAFGPLADPAGAALCTESALTQSSISVAIVVEGSGGPTTACVQLASGANGVDLLFARASALGLPAPRFDPVSGLLCAIDGYPATGCGERTATGYAYWSYWIGDSGNWTYASLGPGGRRLGDGRLDGWRFVSGTGQGSDQPPATAAVATNICVPPPPPTTAPPTTAPPPTNPPTTSPPTTRPPTTVAPPTTRTPAPLVTQAPTTATTAPLSNGSTPQPAAVETVVTNAAGDVVTAPAGQTSGASGESGLSGATGASGPSGGSAPTQPKGASGPSGASGSRAKTTVGSSGNQQRSGTEAAAGQVVATKRAATDNPAGSSGTLGGLIGVIAAGGIVGGAIFLARRRSGKQTEPE